MSEADYRRAVTAAGETRLLPGTGIEVIRDVELSAPPDHVLFDFDGTLSLIREGWPEVMLPMFEELLPPASGDEPASVRAMLLDDIMTLNGRQTIFQMMKFAERVTMRGGEALAPLEYKHEYLRRLEVRIQSRVERLANGDAEPVEFLLHGSIALLDSLQERGWNLYLASGTDDAFPTYQQYRQPDRAYRR